MRSSWRETKTFLLASLALLAWVSTVSSAEEVRREILGIQPQLAKADVQKRLNEIGTFERRETKGQEIWRVRDPSFSHLIVAFGKDDKVRFVTAVAREDADAKRVSYSEIGNLDKARQAGDPGIKNFNYEWELAAQNGMPRLLVSARGRDSTFLTTLSIKKMDGDSAEAK